MDRPRHVAAFEILSGGMRVVLTPAGDRIKRYRKYASTSQVFIRGLTSNEERCMPSSNGMLRDANRCRRRMRRTSFETVSLDQRATWTMPDGTCFATPFLSKHHTYMRQWRFAASLVITMTYGKTTPTTYSDPEVKGIVRVSQHLGKALQPGAYLVDTYPFLKHIPGYLRHLHKIHEEELVFFHGLIADVKRKLVRAPFFERVFEIAQMMATRIRARRPIPLSRTCSRSGRAFG